jgi:phosphoribosyl 1,2-cyclic phosphodiesterase
VESNAGAGSGRDRRFGPRSAAENALRRKDAPGHAGLIEWRRMRVSFYGVRGSVPAPGPATARYGGNTSCVEVRLADDSIVVLDAGTGIRALGRDLLEAGKCSRVHLLLSHTHWDHILGLPFFGPLWHSDTELLIYPLPSDAQERFQRTIFDDIHFPVNANDIPSKVEFVKPAGDS